MSTSAERFFVVSFCVREIKSDARLGLRRRRPISGGNNESQNYFGVFGMQAAQLRHDEEQEK